MASLGNSVIGRWCNLGAGTESSNLKNTYGEVRQWDAQSQSIAGHRLAILRIADGRPQQVRHWDYV